MDFSYTEDQQAIRELSRKILEELATHERLKEIHATEERVDRELWNELAKANLTGVAIAEAHGGSGFGFTELAIVLEEIGRTVAPVPLFPTCVLGGLTIAEHGSDTQQAEWLPKIASGDAILTAALTPQPGAAVQATAAGDGFTLSGTRRLVEAAHVADRILVPAETPQGTALFLVDPQAGGSGVTLEREETTDQQWRSNLTLDGAPAEALGDVANGAAALARIEQLATFGLCAMAVGVSDRALRMTASYGVEREQFDRQIGSFQAFHQRAGDAYVDVVSMRLTLLQAIHQLEQGEDATEALMVAKYWAAEGGARVTYAAQHLHGGIGVDIDYPVHRYYLWARQLGMHLGSGASQLEQLGARL